MTMKENSIWLIPFSRDEVKVWDRLYLRNEKRWYKVQARNDRYIIVTKPHFKTVLYSILDLKNKWMWPDSYVFWMFSYETKEECIKALYSLEKLETEISSRRWCDLTYPNKHIKSEK